MAEVSQNSSADHETELNQKWAAVLENPADFSSWTDLISLSEKQNEINRIRKVYDAFLDEYPLCYVYWKKYADHEFNHGSFDNAVLIYEKGLAQGIPHSVDLWLYYCTFFSEKNQEAAKIRELFERAVAVVGLDPTSNTLWEKYVGWESQQRNFANALALYGRLLAIPLEQLSQFYEKCKEVISIASSQDLVTGCHLRDDSSPVEEKRFKATQAFESLYKASLEEYNSRKPFEAEVQKRSYFHVAPLKDAQISNWHKYLDFEEKQNNHERIVKLYERCIIPCCNYPEFWVRYASYLEKSSKVDEARSVLERASKLLKRKPEIFLEHAAFEEHHGAEERADQLYKKILSFAQHHIQTIIHYAAFLRRHKGSDAAAELFEKHLVEENHRSAFLAMYYARFVYHFTKDAMRTRTIFEKALEMTNDKALWLAYAQFEISINSKEEQVTAIYKKAISSSLSDEDKSELWLSFLEYLIEFGSDIRTYRSNWQEYRATLPAQKPTRKRDLDDGETPAAKVAKTSTGVGSPAQYPQQYAQQYAQYAQYYQQQGYPTGAGAAGATAAGYPGYGQQNYGWAAPQ